MHPGSGAARRSRICTATCELPRARSAATGTSARPAFAKHGKPATTCRRSTTGADGAASALRRSAWVMRVDPRLSQVADRGSLTDARYGAVVVKLLVAEATTLPLFASVALSLYEPPPGTMYVTALLPLPDTVEVMVPSVGVTTESVSREHPDSRYETDVVASVPGMADEAAP